MVKKTRKARKARKAKNTRNTKKFQGGMDIMWPWSKVQIGKPDPIRPPTTTVPRVNLDPREHEQFWLSAPVENSPPVPPRPIHAPPPPRLPKSQMPNLNRQNNKNNLTRKNYKLNSILSPNMNYENTRTTENIIRNNKPGRTAKNWATRLEGMVDPEPNITRPTRKQIKTRNTLKGLAANIRRAENRGNLNAAANFTRRFNILAEQFPHAL